MATTSVLRYLSLTFKKKNLLGLDPKPTKVNGFWIRPIENKYIVDNGLVSLLFQMCPFTLYNG